MEYIQSTRCERVNTESTALQAIQNIQNKLTVETSAFSHSTASYLATSHSMQKHIGSFKPKKQLHTV